MRVTIVCNGEFPKKIKDFLHDCDVIIACDGASTQLIQNGFVPDYIIGDLDSINPSIKEKYVNKIIHFSSQETNDQTKAFTYCIENLAPSEIIFTGNTGKRADHTLGNISLMLEYEKTIREKGIECKISAVSDYSYIYPVISRTAFNTAIGNQISIISENPASSIKSYGLKYPTDGIILSSWWKATLNEATDSTVRIEGDSNCGYLIITTEPVSFI